MVGEFGLKGALDQPRRELSDEPIFAEQVFGDVAFSQEPINQFGVEGTKVLLKLPEDRADLTRAAR